MKVQESRTELKKQAENLREQLLKLRLDLSLNKLKDTNSLKKKRKDLARILTQTKQMEVINA